MRNDRPGKPQWLLIKHNDEHAAPGSDVAAEHQSSVATGRTMDEIAEGRAGCGDPTVERESAYERLMAQRTR